jgi:peptidoglycan/LPS O-acetylase OafA/YrhL
MPGSTERSAAAVPFPKTKASVHLDSIRAGAALLVLLEHWRNMFFVDLGNVQAHGLYKLAVAALYLAASAGHQAVIIFFVLSGFLVGGSVFRSFAKEWTWAGYLTHRLVRLWIVVIPALLLGGILDFTGLHLKRAHALYTGQVHNHMVAQVAAALTLPAFVRNLFFLQGIRGLPFGSNGALWSLANELWYYILFPLAFCALGRVYKSWARVLFALGFLLTAVFVGKPILELFPVWLFGVILYRLPPLRLPHAARVISALLYVPLFFGIAFLSRRGHIGAVALDLLLGVITTAVLWVLLSSADRARNGIGTEVSRWAASFSFSLYALHFPFLLLLTAWLAGNVRWQPRGAHLAEAAGAFFLAIGYSFAVATQTEFRTASVRKRIETRLHSVLGLVPFKPRWLRAPGQVSDLSGAAASSKDG